MSATPEQNVPDAPLASMLIPVFNQAPFVRRAIASALAQTHRDLEILVLDDGSTDASYEIASDFARLRRVGSGHMIAVASKLYRSLGRAEVIERRGLSETEILHRVLQDANGLLGSLSAPGADLPRQAQLAVVLVLVHAARRAGTWHDVVRILALCATRTPRALLRIIQMWFDAAKLDARLARRSGRNLPY
jgi:glycosyltransferase involved in cell wall biosynthesis